MRLFLIIVTIVIIFVIGTVLTIILYRHGKKSYNKVEELLEKFYKHNETILIKYLNIKTIIRLSSNMYGNEQRSISEHNILLNQLTISDLKSSNVNMLILHGKMLKTTLRYMFNIEQIFLKNFTYIALIFKNGTSLECIRGYITIVDNGKTYKLNVNGTCIYSIIRLTPYDINRLYYESLNQVIRQFTCRSISRGETVCSLSLQTNYRKVIDYIVRELSSIVPLIRGNIHEYEIPGLYTWNIRANITISKTEIQASMFANMQSKVLTGTIFSLFYEDYTIKYSVSNVSIRELLRNYKVVNISKNPSYLMSLEGRYLLYTLTMLRNLPIPTPLTNMLIMPAQISTLAGSLYKIVRG